MDRKTIRAYDGNAAEFAVDWEEDQAPPDDIREAVRVYFSDGQTADVGCGSGRDTAWLADNGYDVVGVDASGGLIQEARRRHPGVRFDVDTLPELATLNRGVYANVLCETVIMHLGVSMITEAVRQLSSLLAPNGSLYLTWRVSKNGDTRDDMGRLYAAFEPSLVRDGLSQTDILLDEETISASSGKVIHRIVARRRAKGGL